jgi:hypothetical protein
MHEGIVSPGGPGGLEVDDQLGLGDLLHIHREVGWFGPLQDFVHVSGSAIFPWYDWQTLKGVIGIDGTKTPYFIPCV